MAAAAGRGRTQDIVGHTSVLWRGARVGILFLIIYTVLLLITIRKSYTRFRLGSKSMTLDDLERSLQ